MKINAKKPVPSMEKKQSSSKPRLSKAMRKKSKVLTVKDTYFINYFLSVTLLFLVFSQRIKKTQMTVAKTLFPYTKRAVSFTSGEFLMDFMSKRCLNIFHNLEKLKRLEYHAPRKLDAAKDMDMLNLQILMWQRLLLRL